MGLKRSKLYKIFLRSITFETFIAFIIGLPIAIFLAELIDLISILIMDLNISLHRINLDLKAIGFTLILLMIFIMISLAIIVLKIGNKYQDRKSLNRLPLLISELLLVISFIYYAIHNYGIYLEVILIFVFMDIAILLYIRKIIKDSNTYSYEKSLFLSYIGDNKIILLFILLALTISLINLHTTIQRFNDDMADANLRPHFTVFEDGNLIEYIKGDYNNIFSDIYPVNIKDFDQISDSSFKEGLPKEVDLKNTYSVSAPKLMNYSSYKKFDITVNIIRFF